MVQNDRVTATLEGDYVVFLIGMRFNALWKVHKWWPVVQAMPRMVRELQHKPELGFLHAESWVGRTTLMVQYWRSMEQLLAYAKARDSAHLPAWRAFNQAVGTDGSVGVWHETYAIKPGQYENVYVNMPPFGLGRAGQVHPATGERKSASDRIRAASVVKESAVNNGE